MTSLTGPAGSSLTAEYTPKKAESKSAPQAPAEPQKNYRVLVAQQALLSKGFSLEPDAPNGILGPQTKKAIATFQSQAGIEPTGEPDDQTLSLLTRKDDAQVMFGGHNA